MPPNPLDDLPPWVGPSIETVPPTPHLTIPLGDPSPVSWWQLLWEALLKQAINNFKDNLESVELHMEYCCKTSKEEYFYGLDDCKQWAVDVTFAATQNWTSFEEPLEICDYTLNDVLLWEHVIETATQIEMEATTEPAPEAHSSSGADTDTFVTSTIVAYSVTPTDIEGMPTSEPPAFGDSSTVPLNPVSTDESDEYPTGSGSPISLVTEATDEQSPSMSRPEAGTAEPSFSSGSDVSTSSYFGVSSSMQSTTAVMSAPTTAPATSAFIPTAGISTSTSTGSLIGGAVGGVAILICGVLVLVCLCRGRKRPSTKSTEQDASSPVRAMNDTDTYVDIGRTVVEPIEMYATVLDATPNTPPTTAEGIEDHDGPGGDYRRLFPIPTESEDDLCEKDDEEEKAIYANLLETDNPPSLTRSLTRYSEVDTDAMDPPTPQARTPQDRRSQASVESTSDDDDSAPAYATVADHVVETTPEYTVVSAAVPSSTSDSGEVIYADLSEQDALETDIEKGFKQAAAQDEDYDLPEEPVEDHEDDDAGAGVYHRLVSVSSDEVNYENGMNEAEYENTQDGDAEHIYANDVDEAAGPRTAKPPKPTPDHDHVYINDEEGDPSYANVCR